MMLGEALGFGVALAGGAVLIMGLAPIGRRPGCRALTIGFYVVVYTMWLKRRTPQNIVMAAPPAPFRR